MDFRLNALLLLVCAFSFTEGQNPHRKPHCKGKGCHSYGGGYGGGIMMGMGGGMMGMGGGMMGYGGGGGMGSYYGRGGMLGIGGSGTGGAGIGIGINGIGIGRGGAGTGGPGIGSQFISGGYGGGYGGEYGVGYGGGYGYGGGMGMGMGMGRMFPYRGWHYFPFPGLCPFPSHTIYRINKRWWWCRIWFPK